jgi:hypothetical protein
MWNIRLDGWWIVVMIVLRFCNVTIQDRIHYNMIVVVVGGVAAC